ncbi:TerB family tellurite resistance protein [Aliiglaciecola sp. 3_MG-2023]|uniref:tellurite resistance TerB family protein n=1 Tax=Aliiglaciecola sp. 3_MG-2023 TaxID=3062644 RepID=UPI0026E318E9|nr:TerB family tellurite resistance protein [Aliiglaciecola sp. 3_MG-2023]MDO6691660.1 TerB family tellurite resistance protein [Aliiglaciecola sp. 3_MG-2023]
MFKALSDWFQQNLQQHDPVSEQQTIELATAVLLFEIMRADGKFEASEQDTYQQILKTHFDLTESELASLMKLSSDQAKQAVDYHQFTRTINQHCDVQEKRQILESLWRVAYADKHLDVHEINLIRRISDLLHIPHSEFIQSKLKVTENTG